MDIRRALPADLPAVAAIYAREAREGHATFDVEGRPMDAWEARLAADGVHAVVAGVALPNPASLALHRAVGFEQVGVMRQVGRKLGRWIDLVWLQRLLG